MVGKRQQVQQESITASKKTRENSRKNSSEATPNYQPPTPATHTCAAHNSSCACMRPSCGASAAASAGPKLSGQAVNPSL